MSRGGLDDRPFAYRVLGDGRVTISWRGRPATTLAGRAASRFLARAEVADEGGRQLLMAKATSNFKRGNERS